MQKHKDGQRVCMRVSYRLPDVQSREGNEQFGLSGRRSSRFTLPPCIPEPISRAHTRRPSQMRELKQGRGHERPQWPLANQGVEAALNVLFGPIPEAVCGFW